ncbi:hypothetical protein [Pseudanabaena sp. ABRG5-3]|uniref:hypothetical protein n=1 Tax=Pseudanabaena sp. ABRG5-3 TaxID=685565 RepID=UPI000F845F80|nr:hypothetical protein [Pseudanabaena sp. ABRG5-3]
MNRQPLNVELLTLDDGTQKIAWDIKQLQSLLGISDLLHQEELSSSSATNTGVNSAGIPTIETVIAILDELGLKDLYEVRYRKQYATIIPKTDSKRPKVAIYVVQQQEEIALSIHNKIWTNYLARFYWNNYDEYYGTFQVTIELYVPPIEKPEFFGRIIEFIGDTDIDASNFEENSYFSTSGYKLPYSDIPPIIEDMTEQNICYELSSDQRFPSTSRISFSHHSELKGLLLDLVENLTVFLRSNGEKPYISSNDEDNTSSNASSADSKFH